MKRVSKIKKLVIASMFAALCCVSTLVVQIPTPTQGYLHLGDAVVLLCGWVLGPVWGGLAAGIGSMMADVFGGFILYAPATFLIKGGVAVLGWLIHTLLGHCIIKHKIIALALSGIVAELFMVLGYFVFEALFCGYGWAAIVGVPANIVQASFGVIVGTILMHLMERMHVRERFIYGTQTKY